MEFSKDEIRLLAEGERKMDSGEQPHVVNEGDRVAVMPEVMEDLGLESGQTVSNAIIIAILKAQIEILSACPTVH